MNWLDIVIGLLLLLAVWEGWRQGLVRQALGLAALILGIFLALKFGAGLGAAFGLKGAAASVVGFTVVLAATIAAMGLLGWLTRGLFRLTGLGLFDNILGVALSGLKMLLVAGALLALAEFADPKEKFLTRKTKKSSTMYKAATAVTGFVFPRADTLAGKIREAGECWISAPDGGEGSGGESSI